MSPNEQQADVRSSKKTIGQISDEIDVLKKETILKTIGDKIFIAGSYALKKFIELKDLDIEFESDDIDIFLKSADYEVEVCNHIFSIPEVEILKEDKNSIIFKHNNQKYQLIKPRETEHFKSFGAPEEVISRFDFSITQIAYDLENDTFIALDEKELISDLKAKRLRIKHIVCPISMVYRVCKYAKKGFKLSMMETLKIFDSWDKRPKLKEEIKEIAEKVQETDDMESVYRFIDKFIID